MEQASKPQSTSNVQQYLESPSQWPNNVINSHLVLKALKPNSLRTVFSQVEPSSLKNQTTSNPVEQLGQAVGLERNIQVEKTITIGKSVAELYDYWRNLANLPKFMHHLRSITVKDEYNSHWVANAPLNTTVEWDARIIKDEPYHLIAWTSVEGANIDNCGFVRFQPATGKRGTEVKVVLEYNPPGGVIGSAIAKLFGEEPQQQIGDELNRLKQLMETGEITTTKGQSKGG
ncbi:cyclase/dehydrase [Stanieria sp. NIES-3757]|nr:cyclase/dehydrase [Stanieria sp. NIES-3757]